MIWNLIGRKILYPLIFFTGLVIWIFATESGLNSLFKLAKQLSPYSLSVKEIHGKLIDEVQIKELIFESPTLKVEISELVLQLQPHALLNNVIKIPAFLIKKSFFVFGNPSNAPLYIDHATGALELKTNLHPLFVQIQNIEGSWKNQPITGQGGLSIINRQLKLFNTALKLGENQLNVTFSPTDANHLNWTLITKPSDEFQAELQGTLVTKPKSNQWAGEITRTTIRSTISGIWTQKKPSSLTFSDTHFSIEPLILENRGGALAKLFVDWQAKQGLSALLDIPTLSIQHPNIHGKVSIHFTANQKPKKALEAKGLITVHPGTVQISLGHRNKKLFYQGGKANIFLSDQTLSAQVTFKENEKNSFDGNFQIASIKSFRSLFNQPLAGNFTAHWSDLSLLYTFIPHIAKLKASLAANGEVRGTLKNPSLHFLAKAEKASFFMPKLQTQVHDLKLVLNGDIPGTLTWNGIGTLNKGQFYITGTSETKKPFQTSLSLEGKALQIYNTPNIQIIATPMLTLHFVNNALYVQGTVHIPSASIELQNEVKRTALSKDIIYIGAKTEDTTPSTFRIIPNLYLILEKEVHFKGYGLDGFVSGKLEIDERPDGLLSGTGRLIIKDGKYRLQGSTRYIHRGRLLFPPGTLLNDPILDIFISQKRAEEFQEGAEMDLTVQGTLQKPMVELYTSANSRNAEILSKLNTTGSENSNPKQNQFFSNPTFLLGGGANPFLDRLQTNLGIEEFSFESKESKEPQTSIFTQGGTDTLLVVGKSLSKQLYLQYLQFVAKPVTTIRLKYYLTPRITASVETGTEEDIGGDLTFSLEKD